MFVKISIEYYFPHFDVASFGYQKDVEKQTSSTIVHKVTNEVRPVNNLLFDVQKNYQFGLRLWKWDFVLKKEISYVRNV